MDDADARPEFSRGATFEDLIELCRHLNEAGARYVVIGGFAVIYHGLFRGTFDIDLLIEDSPENLDKIKNALLYLPDQAIRQVKPEEISKYQVVRVADEVVVDLMTKACSVTYNHAAEQIEKTDVQGVQIPFAKPEVLILTKDTYRPKDAVDKEFLEELIRLSKEPEKKKSWWRW